MQSKFCPEDTKNPYNLASVNLCPSGQYCPDLKTRKACPAGFFCVTGSTAPVKCQLGMYCPENCSVPNNWCAIGHYCPDPSQQLPVPGNTFAKQGYAQAQECPWLSVCRAGAEVPNRAPMIALGVVVLFCLFCLFFLVLYLENLRRNCQADASLKHHMDAHKSMSIPEWPSRGKIGNEPSGAYSPQPVPANIRFQDLSLKIRKTGQVVVKGVTGEFKHSSLIAVMGPSGAGKTSFLNCLTGKTFYGQRGGRVEINGHPVKDMSTDEMRKEMWFVPQDDIVNDILTVRDNLYYSAMLRLPADMPRAQKIHMVDDVIELLDLAPQARKRWDGTSFIPNLVPGRADQWAGFLHRAVGSAKPAQHRAPRRHHDSGGAPAPLRGIPGVRPNAAPGRWRGPCVPGTGVRGRELFCFDWVARTSEGNPADFFMDVIAGLVKHPADPDFTPDKLSKIWSDHLEKVQLRSVCEEEPLGADATASSPAQSNNISVSQLEVNPAVQIGKQDSSVDIVIPNAEGNQSGYVASD
eukprot:g65058.t1